MPKIVSRRKVLALGSAALAFTAWGRPPALASVVTTAPKTLNLSPVFAEVLAKAKPLLAASRKACATRQPERAADRALREAVTPALDAEPQTLDDCDALELCEEYFIEAMLGPEWYFDSPRPERLPAALAELRSYRKKQGRDVAVRERVFARRHAKACEEGSCATA